MKIHRLPPEKLIGTILAHLSVSQIRPETKEEYRIRRFLRGDKGMLAGALLNICGIVQRCAELERRLSFGYSGAGIEFSFSGRGKCMNICLTNISFFHVPEEFCGKNNKNKKIKIHLHMINYNLTH